jgi:hypothetical protein
VYLTGQRRSKAVVSATLVHHRHMCASERPNRKIEYLAGSHLRNRWYQRHSYVKFIIVPLRDELAIDALSLAMLVSTSIERADMSICEIRIHGDAVKKGIVSLNDSSFIRVCRRWWFKHAWCLDPKRYGQSDHRVSQRLNANVDRLVAMVYMQAGKIFQSQWNVVNWNRISRWCLSKKPCFRTDQLPSRVTTSFDQMHDSQTAASEKPPNFSTHIVPWWTWVTWASASGGIVSFGRSRICWYHWDHLWYSDAIRSTIQSTRLHVIRKIDPNPNPSRTLARHDNDALFAS